MSDNNTGNAPTPHPPLTVASATPGRIRLRVPKSLRDPDRIRGLEQHLAKRADVSAVKANHRTGSILLAVDHPTEAGPPLDGDENAARDVAILDDLDEIGNVLSFGMGGAEVDGIAAQLGSTIARLNARIHAATGEDFHLGTVVPGSMAVVGVWQTVRNGLGLELIPGPLMLWLAWDLYRVFGNVPTEGQRRAE